MQTLEPIAHCRRCDGYFTLPNIFGIVPGSNVNVTFGGAGTSCPMCGGAAEILDATYEITNGILTEVKGLNQQRIQALLRVLSQVRGDIPNSPESILDDIEKLEPGLAVILRRLASKKFGVAALLILLMMILRQCSGGPLIDIDVNQFSNTLNIQADSTDTDDANDKKKHRHRDDSGQKSTQVRQAQKPKIPDTIHDGPNRREKRKAKALARKNSGRPN